MAIDSKYGVINIEGIGVNEPIFVLRAQDIVSIPILYNYKELREKLIPHDFDFSRHMEYTIAQFECWNGRKLPT